MAFQAKYVFAADGKMVVLRHKQGKYLRIKPDDQDELNQNGGTGKWARWHIEFDGEQDDCKVVKLKHAASDKYLRVYNNGNTIDAGGGGGKWTRFKLHITGDNSAKLESCELEGKYPAVKPNGPGIGGGGPYTEFEFFRQGGGGGGNGGDRAEQKGGGAYQNAYFFNGDGEVVINTFFGKYLNVKPKNDTELGGKGGTGGFARWNVTLDGEQDDFKVVKLQSTKTDKYLRIFGDDGESMDVGGGGGKWTRFKVRPTSDNSVKFESCELEGKFVAVRQNGVGVGGGGKFTEFSVWSNSEDGDAGDAEDQKEPEPVEEVEVVEAEPEEPAEEEPVEEEPVEEEPAEEPAVEEPVEEEPVEEPVEEEPVEEPVEEEAAPEEAEPEEKEPVEFDEADIHEQPLKDPRPSIEPAAEFDEEIAKKEASNLRSAMKGMGTNERKITAVTNGFSHAQRMEIKGAYNTEYERDLIKDLKKELSGKFEKLCVGFWLDAGRYDAEQIDEAVNGLGFSTKLLNEIICTRSTRQLSELQSAWWKGMSVVDRIKDETDKGSGNYCTLLVTLLEGGRAVNGPADSDAAQADAELLNRYLNQESESDAKAKFVELFTTRSWVQIREISGIFQDVSKKYTLNGAIEKAFGDGDTSKALQTIDEFASQPYDFWAKKLRDAMKGMGTDDEQLRRVIISRAEVDLRDVGIIFGQRYGDGKTMSKWIKDDTKGDYEKLCLAVCGLD